MLRFVSLALAFGLSPSSVGAVEPSAEDVAPGIPFQEGEILDLKSIQKIKDFLPPPFWKHRDLIFFEGMQMEIGPFFADYSPNEARQALTEKYRGTAKIGRGEALENYTLGQPFPDIDPEDPQLDIKHAWNAAYKHDAQEGQGSFYFTYWDEGGEQLPLYYEGTGWGMRLAHRTDRADTEGRVFKKEKRMGAGGFHVTAPFDARGILGLGYRYLAWEKAPDEAKDDDIWIWIPDLRRVRRISGARRTDAIAGTDFTPEDRGGFSGLVPDYTWEYLGEQDVLAPINTKRLGYPLEKNRNFGPSGMSHADDRWELRHAIILEQTPKDERHPYSRKTLWYDAQTYVPLFSAPPKARSYLEAAR